MFLTSTLGSAKKYILLSFEQFKNILFTTPTMTYQCAVCLELNEQILMLACSHDVCISCAAHHFKQSTKIQADFQLKKSF